ncbi:MAG: restriction endonuclease subunit S [Thiobacillus sp.]
MSEWVEALLAQLVTFQKGRKVDTSPFDGDGYAPYLGASGLEGGDDGYAATRLAVIAKSTDTLMLWDGERSGLVGHGRQGVVASTVSKLSPSDKVEPKYLYYALSERFDWIQHRRTGTGVPHVPKDLGRLLKLRYPKHRAVQQRIASILSGIDTAIEKTETLIAKYQQIKAGLMHDLFTRGVLPNGQLRPPREGAPKLYQETAIGLIPREWSVRKLGTMAKIVSGVTLGPKKSASGGIEVPYLRVANVQDGYLDLTEIKTVQVTRKELEQLRLQVGDVLMNEGGDFDKLGRGAVWSGEIEDCVHQNHVFRVRTDPTNLRPYFLAFYSESSFGKKYFLISSKQSTNLASINSTQLNAYPIALPPLVEQQAIIERISAANGRIDQMKAEAGKLRHQKSGLMYDLLTGKVKTSTQNVEVENA